jgi:hypothetical protein
MDAGNVNWFGYCVESIGALEKEEKEGRKRKENTRVR